MAASSRFREVRRLLRRGTFLDRVTAQSESGGRDFTRSGAPVTSSKGAKFAMQVLPTTAGDPGFGVTPARDSSPAESNRVGREYRAAMFKRYGDPAKGWAAYVWGPGNLDAHLQRYGPDWLRHAPNDVQSYVTRNLQAMGG
jgi:soluble lytic murein transglycosylase